MSNPTTDLTPMERAIVFGTHAHAGQKRKVTGIPYIWHPLRVAALLLEVGCEEPVVVAGVLHDTLEDTKTTPDDIAREFGPEVLEIVRGASEPDKGADWEVRKQYTIEHMRTAPAEVKLVKTADKLDNIRSMARDLVVQGEGMWGKFKRGRAKQEWYFRGILDSLAPDFPVKGAPLLSRLRAAVAEVFGRPGSS